MTRPMRHAHLFALIAATIAATDGSALRAALAAYEATGDHDHGRGPIPPGGPCGMGDDCWVRRARAVLAAIDALAVNDYRTTTETDR